MPGDAILVEAGKNGDEQSTDKPPNIFDPSALLVYLEGKVSYDLWPVSFNNVLCKFYKF